ncbi:x globin isoform X1 [Stegostoma tigrinum]|uniref:x globin isoform X1 n=1 Tax=Stegostoma tigrinum TaxID=3053191 RepID=UPI002870A327|nr:x globin isoform X1 [Stegostoma tigrinum]
MGCALSGTGLDPGKAGVDVSSATPRSEAGGSELVASDSYPPLPLSEQQKDLIQQSWKVLHQDIARVGIIMFIRLFETHPECKDIFFLFRDIDDLQQLKMSKELQSHGLRVMSFIEKSVARLTQQDKLEQLAFDLGRSHYRYNAPPKYYEYVGVQFIAVVKPILKEKWTADVEEAWKGLFEYLTRTMKRGYHDAEQRDNVNRGNYTKRRAPSALKASQNAV